MTTPAALENPVVAPPRDTPDEQGFLTKLGSAFAMFRNGKSIAGLVILGVFILVAIFADVIAPASPTAVDPKARLQPPSAEHWLGTTHLGEGATVGAYAILTDVEIPAGAVVAPFAQLDRQTSAGQR